MRFVHTKWVLLFVLGMIFAPATVLAIDLSKLQVGDVVFQQSQSTQSIAVAEATNSPWTHVGIIVRLPNDSAWYVAEAASSSMNVVRLTDFIANSRNNEVVVKRFNKNIVDTSNSNNQSLLLKEINKFGGRNYDIFFEWNDESTYCSEMVSKAYVRAFGILPGQLQLIRQLNITGPAVKKLMELRQKMKGSPINLDEPLVTPVSIFNDTRMVTVTTN